MLKSAELGRALSKQDYDAALGELRTSLLKAQAELERAKFPVIVLIHGADGTGKTETLNLLNEWLDARYLRTEAYQAASEEERERPGALHAGRSRRQTLRAHQGSRNRVPAARSRAVRSIARRELATTPGAGRSRGANPAWARSICASSCPTERSRIWLHSTPDPSRRPRAASCGRSCLHSCR
jgi:hypothetical protein